MNELSDKFPHLNHRPFWKRVFQINEEGWKVLRNLYSFKSIRLLPNLFFSTDLMIRRFQLEDPSYLELLNGILLISAQSHASRVPFLVGAMALAYPSSCYAPEGGMKGLMDFFQEEMKEHGVDLKLKTKVDKIPDGFDKVFSNVPSYKEGEGMWGALTIYFGVKSEIHEPYHQVHVDRMNYFVSFSLVDDLSRAPAGYQAVTISTHVPPEYVRDELIEEIMNDFLKRFPVSDVKYFTTGTPKTFERYTGRLKGYVGGIPLLLGKIPKLDTVFPSKKLYRVGDTVFPGQGLCGVVAGALLLHRRLTKE
jgi:phytoene dehydrogenase-like protein